jgi:hypothetical protein
VIGAPSRLRLIRKAAALARIFPHFDFSIEENAAPSTIGVSDLPQGREKEKENEGNET